MGAVFDVLSGMANAYPGLRVGLPIRTAIPLEVVFVTLFKSFKKVRGKPSILYAVFSCL